MTLLSENAVAIAVLGVLATTVALVVFLARRNVAALAALVAAIGATGLLLVVERLVVTDREAVAAAVEEVLDAIESNDVPGLLAWIDPAAANVKADAERLMPLVKVKTANAAAADVDVNAAANPPTAAVQFRAYLHGVHATSGTPLLYANQRVDLEWVKRDDGWRITAYQAYYDDVAIDAVGSVRGNRPQPGR